MRCLADMEVMDKGLLYEYAANVSGMTQRLRPEYCRKVSWKDAGWYLTWFVFRYCLECKTYEEALTFATVDTLNTYCLYRFYERDGRMFIGLGEDILGNAAETFEVELSGNRTTDSVLWALRVALDILYHDIPPAKQLEAALSHPSSDPLQRRHKNIREVASRLAERSSTIQKKLLGLLSIVLLLFLFALSPCKADGERVQYDPNGNAVPEGGMNMYQGVSVNSKEEALALEDRLLADGYILFRRDQIPERNWALLMMPDVHLWFRTWMDEAEYPPDRCHIYVYGATYRSALAQLETQPYLEWYTEMEFAFSTVLVNYLPFDAREKVGTQSDIFNDACLDEEAAWLQILSPVSTEVRLRQVYSLQYYVFYVAAGEPFLVKLPYGSYEVSALNAIPVSQDDGFFALSHEETSEAEPKVVNLKALCDKYKVPNWDIAGKPNYSLTGSGGVYGDEYRVLVPTVEPEQKEEPQKKSVPDWLWWVLGGFGAAMVIAGFIIISKVRKIRRGGVL